MILPLLMSAALAQAPEEAPIEHTLSLSGGVAQRVGVVSLSYVPYFGVGERRRFRLGPGVRASGLGGSDLRLAEVNTDTAGDGGPDQDALEVDSLLLGTVNLGLYLEYQLGARWQLGMSWDAIGLPFGGTSATFTTPDGLRVPVDEARTPWPSVGFTRGQVISDNLWVGFTPAERWQISLGSFAAGVELEMPEPPAEGVEELRYERTSMLGVKLGVSVVL